MRRRRLVVEAGLVTLLAAGLTTVGRPAVERNAASLRALPLIRAGVGPAAEAAWLPCGDGEIPAARLDVAAAGLPIAVALRQDCLAGLESLTRRSSSATDALWAGIALERQGRHADALDAWRDAGVSQYFSNVAILRTAPGRDLTRRFARYILELEGDDWRAALEVGKQLREVDPEGAVDVLQRASAIAPAESGIALELGVVYTRLGRHDAAAEAYGRAADLDPRSVEAWQGLGESAYYAGDARLALDAFERVRALVGESAPLTFWLDRARAAVTAMKGR